MDNDRLMRRTERWFVRQGVPQLIADYGFRTHVLPRLIPTLGVGAALAVTGGLLGTAAGAAAPVVVAAAAVGFAAYSVLAVTALAYGLVPLAAQATRHAWADMRGSLRLQGRALPTLLFATFFLFFTSELWQLMDQLAWGRLVLLLLLFAAVTVLATSTRLRGEVDRVEHDLNRDRLANACAGTPLADLVADEIPTPTPLTPRQERRIASTGGRTAGAGGGDTRRSTAGRTVDPADRHETAPTPAPLTYQRGQRMGRVRARKNHRAPRRRTGPGGSLYSDI